MQLLPKEIVAERETKSWNSWKISKSFKGATKSNEFIHSFFLETYIAPLQETTTQRRKLALGHKQMWLSSRQSRTQHPETSAWTGHLLLSYNRPWLWVLPINWSSSNGHCQSFASASFYTHQLLRLSKTEVSPIQEFIHQVTLNLPSLDPNGTQIPTSFLEAARE